MNNNKSQIKQPQNEKNIEIFLNNTNNELKKVAKKMVNLYSKQCQVLSKQIKQLVKLEPNKNYKSAHLKWQNELSLLEDNYNLIFNKYLEEKKELDKVNRLNLF